MSKSSPEPASRILITDTPEQIRAKVKRAVTDGDSSLSYDPQNRPGVSNLLLVLAALTPRGAGEGNDVDPATVAQRLNDEHGGSSAALKTAVTDTVVEALRPIREKLDKLRADQSYLDQIEQKGRAKAQAVASQTMREVKQLVGLGP